MRPVFALGALFIGASLIWGPTHWHTSPSMMLVQQLGIPWDVWGLLFIAYSMLLYTNSTRVFGFFLGFVLYSFFTGSFIYALSTGRSANIVLLVVAVNATIQQAVWGVKSMIQEARRT